MARKELVQYIDDMDGTPIKDEDVQVVRFSYRGKNYFLDLTEDNARKFDEAMAPFIENAQVDDAAPAATRTRRAAAANNPNAARQRERNRIIRQWAKDRGMAVADRGALPKSIIEEYEKAHG